MEIYVVEGYNKFGKIADPVIFKALDAKSANTIETLLKLLFDADVLENWEKKEMKSI